MNSVISWKFYMYILSSFSSNIDCASSQNIKGTQQETCYFHDFLLLSSKHIQGTPALKSKDTCVDDACSNIHPEVMAVSKYSNNRYLFRQSYLQQLNINSQLFITGINSIKEILPPEYKTTMLLQWAGLEDGEDAFDYDYDTSKFAGYDNPEYITDLQQEKQASRGYHHHKCMSNLQKEMRQAAGLVAGFQLQEKNWHNKMKEIKQYCESNDTIFVKQSLSLCKW